MFGIFKRYRRLLSRDAAASFNRMAAFLTNFCSNESIRFDRPDEPSADNPPCISIDAGWMDSNYVTLDTAQTIAGEKCFQNVLRVSDGTASRDAQIYVNSGGLNIAQAARLTTQANAVVTKPSVGETSQGHVDINPKQASLELVADVNATNGGYIDFHYAGSSSDYTSRIIDTANTLALQAVGKSIHLYSYDNGTAGGITVNSSNGDFTQLLTNEPARLYSTGLDSQIASRGYCRLNFSRSTHTHGNISNDGKITNAGSGTSTSYYIAADSNGNLYRKATSDLAPDLSSYVTSSQLTSALASYALSSDVSSLSGIVSDLVDQVDGIAENYQTASDVSSAILAELADYPTASDVSSAIQTALADYVTDSDLDDYLAVDDVGAANGVCGLDGNAKISTSSLPAYTAGKWMKTDSNGNIGVTDDVPAAFSSTPTASRIVLTGQNGTLSTLGAAGESLLDQSFVTDVSWNGTQLVIKKRTFTFTDGVLTGKTSTATTNIDTVTYNPS